MPERLTALLAALRRLVPSRLTTYFQTLLAPGLSPWQRARHAARGIVFAGLGAVVLLVAYALLLIPFTPAVERVAKAPANEHPSVLLAADGSTIATYRRINREWIPLERVPQHVVDAL